VEIRPDQGIVGQHPADYFLETDRREQVKGVRVRNVNELSCGARQLVGERSKHRNGLAAERREYRPAAPASTGGCLDQWFPGRRVDRLHELPGTAVGHGHLPGGAGDAAVTFDLFEKFEPTGAKNGLSGAFGPNANADGPTISPQGCISGHFSPCC
jgi:hypothetical protein